MYRRLIPLLAQTRRVIAFDPPGTGESFAPPEAWTLARLAESVQVAAATVAGAPFALYGMNGGNKLGVALCDAHPDTVSAFVFAGLTHSIVVSNAQRASTLGAHPSVRAILAGQPPAPDWRSLAALAADGSDVDAERATDEMVDRLQSARYRRHFYAAVTDFDMETPLRAMRVPIGVLEFTTAEEDESIGRQGAVTAAAVRATAHAAMKLLPGESLALESRAGELAERIHALLGAIEG